VNNIDVLLEPLRAFLHQVGDLLPRLLVALIVVIAGWIVAKAVRYAAERGLRAVNFNVLADRSGLDGFLKNGGIRSDTTEIVARLCYWLVILAALLVAFNSLGLVYVTDVLGKILLFVPRLLVAILVLAFGGYFARFVANAIVAYCRNIHVQDADLLGRIAQYAIVTFVVLIALDTLDVGGDIIRETFLVLLAGVVFAFALAFGLGGQDWAREMLERWWPRKK
jgi:flagellar biosynthesis protein FliQ